MEALYQQLKQLLQQQHWQQANDLTNSILLEALGKTEADYINTKEANLIPCRMLERLNRLWQENSGDKFGFSVQCQLWRSAQQNSFWHGNYFAQSVGWRNGDKYLTPQELNFSLEDAPIGHLPYLLETNGSLSKRRGFWLFRPLLEKMQQCHLI